MTSNHNEGIKIRDSKRVYYIREEDLENPVFRMVIIQREQKGAIMLLKSFNEVGQNSSSVTQGAKEFFEIP